MSHKHDYIERWRRYYYPKLDSFLDNFGLYSVANVGHSQYAATLFIGEEAAEIELIHSLGFERNPVAAYKTHNDGRKSELSLRLTGEKAGEKYGGEYVDPGYQLHLTFFEHDGKPDGAVDVYAHYEHNWEVSPFKHLRGADMQREQAAEKFRDILRNHSMLVDEEDYAITPDAVK